jgi:hypothetical protein
MEKWKDGRMEECDNVLMQFNKSSNQKINKWNNGSLEKVCNFLTANS